MMDLPSPMWWLLAAVMVPASVLSGVRLWVLDRREHEQRMRLDAFRGPVNQIDGPVYLPWYQHLGNWCGPIIGVVEQQRLLKLLAQAGIKGSTSLASFITMKVLAALMLGSLTWVFQLFASYMIFRVAALGAGMMLGWRLPDVILHYLVSRRRLRLEHGMPDALDLLVICAESGLSLNQAIEEISKQLRLSNSDLADELDATSAEMRITPDFGKALDNLVVRTGLTDLGGLVATLKQSIKFGTPLAESLRMIAAEMRAERQSRIEARVARLPVLLAIPMLLFILPCVMMIVATPVVLRLIDTLKHITIGGFSALR